MPIEKMDLINNPETAPFSKLKYLRRLPDEEVAEFFNKLFLLNVAARDSGDWAPVDRYLEERGDQIASHVAVPCTLMKRPGLRSKSDCPNPRLP